jgi:predicted nucleic acid-binding protein
MALQSQFRVVVDTNVVFEGLTKQGGAADLIIDSWLAGLLYVCVSDALAYEYADILSRKLSETRWNKIKPVLGNLLRKAYFIYIYYSWRPNSPDPGSEKVIDCAMNANAIVITSNVKDFRLAKDTLGLQVMKPVDFILELAKRMS